jgi:hypothetical protein
VSRPWPGGEPAVEGVRAASDSARQPPGRDVTTGVLIDGEWELDYVGDTRNLDVDIKQLRPRIEADPVHPVLIAKHVSAPREHRDAA